MDFVAVSTLLEILPPAVLGAGVNFICDVSTLLEILRLWRHCIYSYVFIRVSTLLEILQHHSIHKCLRW